MAPKHLFGCWFSLCAYITTNRSHRRIPKLFPFALLCRQLQILLIHKLRQGWISLLFQETPVPGLSSAFSSLLFYVSATVRPLSSDSRGTSAHLSDWSPWSFITAFAFPQLAGQKLGQKVRNGKQRAQSGWSHDQEAGEREIILTGGCFKVKWNQSTPLVSI